MSQDKMLKWALTYFNKEGWQVIPSREKKALVSGWGKGGSLVIDEKQIEGWWGDEFKEANISLLCGTKSNILVLDTDTQDAEERLRDLLPRTFSGPVSKTPSGGRHRFFRWQSGFSSRRYMEGLDVKTDGGLVVLPPSENAKGGYSWEVHIKEVKPPPLPNRLRKYLSKLVKEHKRPQLSTADHGLNFSRNRNESFFDVGCLLRDGGASPQLAEYILQTLRDGCGRSDHPFTPQEVSTIVSSVYQKPPRNVAQEVLEFVMACGHGVFTSTEVYMSTHLSTKEDKKAALEALRRLQLAGVIERYGKRAGCYIKPDTTDEIIDYLAADEEELDIKLPLGLHKHFEAIPGDLYVCSGMTNSGKTAMALNCILMNQHKHEVHLFSSEIRARGLKKRLRKFNDMELDKWKFVPHFTPSNWHQKIVPGAINIIDYIQLSGAEGKEFYMIGQILEDIHAKVGDGVAIVFLQKKRRSDFAYGGELSLHYAAFAINLDPVRGSGGKLEGGICEITKCKNFRGTENPEGKVLRYKLINGCEFLPETEWRYETKKYGRAY